MIDIGALDISAMRVGSTDASQAYVGDTLVWSAIQPVTTGLCCEYQVSATGVTTIGNSITSRTQTMNVDGVDYSASTTFNFTRAGKHYVSWGDVTDLPIDAFANVTALTKVNFQTTTSFIGAYAFSGCTGLKHADMSDTAIWAMNYGAFSGCTSLLEISLGPVRKIQDEVFYYCNSVTAITIPSTVSSIGSRAFSFIQDMGNSVLEIPGSVTAITDYEAFSDGIYGGIVLNEGLTSIGRSCFQGCYLGFMNQIEIPASVTGISDSAFANMFDVDSFKFKGSTPPSMSDHAFYATSVDYVYVPSGSSSSYQSVLEGMVNFTYGEIVEF